MESRQERQGGEKIGRTLLIVNCVILAIGNCGGPLIMRLYFVHGGARVWLSSLLQTAGFPLVLAPLAALAIRRRRRDPTAPISLLRPRLIAAAAVVGIITGLDDYLYAYGMARLPVSTSSLIIASQLAFTAGFAFLLVRQRLTPFSLNAVVLLTVGGAVLALNTAGDRPAGESASEYAVGFGMTVAAAALYGFILPLVELTYKKSKQEISYAVVLEYQFVMCLLASAFCAIGMIVNNDFQVIPREAREYELGESMYYVVLVMSAVIWQGFFLGAIGVVFCFSSLFSGIIIAVLLPLTEVLAVIVFKESFKAEKGVSLVLSLWGFVSYFFGEFKRGKKIKDENEMEKPAETEIACIQSTESV